MHLLPSTADLLALGVANLQPAMLRAETMSACNNACWSLGASQTLLARPDSATQSHAGDWRSRSITAQHCFAQASRHTAPCPVSLALKFWYLAVVRQPAQLLLLWHQLRVCA